MPPKMRQRLRAYFLSNKAVQRRTRHQSIISCMSPGLQGEVVMLMNKRWIAKVSLLNQILQVAKSRSRRASAFTSFIVAVSLKMQIAAHAVREVFGEPHTLHILVRGIVARKGMIAKTGSVWGVDFVLSDSSLAQTPESHALTYIEVMTLHRDDFLACVSRYVDRTRELHRIVRYHTKWTTFQRYALKEARRRIQEKRGFTNDASGRLSKKSVLNLGDARLSVRSELGPPMALLDSMRDTMFSDEDL